MTGQERGPDPKALQPRSSALLEFATSTSGCTDLNWRGSVALAHAQHVRARVSGWDSQCGGRELATAHATAGGSATREWAALDAERLITLAPRDAAAPAPPAGANDKHLIFSTVNG